MHVVRRLNPIISKCRLCTNIIIVLFTAINIFTFIIEISNELKITYTSTYSGINGVLESIFLEWNDTVSYILLDRVLVTNYMHILIATITISYHSLSISTL